MALVEMFSVCVWRGDDDAMTRVCVRVFLTYRKQRIGSHVRACASSRIMCNTSQKSCEVFLFLLLLLFHSRYSNGG